MLCAWTGQAQHREATPNGSWARPQVMSLTNNTPDVPRYILNYEQGRNYKHVIFKGLAEITGLRTNYLGTDLSLDMA